MEKSTIIVAVDGPSGAGKSTIGKMLARTLKALYIDTGAMYRAVALAALEAGIDTAEQDAVAQVVRRSRIALQGEPATLRVMLDDRDVTDLIRTEEVTRASSVISAIPEVRRILVERQREMGREGSVVMDGRDIGTVVFPQADFKFFLTAKPEKRALRRFEEALERSSETSYRATLEDIIVRDERDSTRTDSPLTPAPDSILIDSTDLSIEQVLERMLEEIRKRNETPKNVESPASFTDHGDT
jgi:cytidylate kinase